jgi:hypothetical protein
LHVLEEPEPFEVELEPEADDPDSSEDDELELGAAEGAGTARDELVTPIEDAFAVAIVAAAFVDVAGRAEDVDAEPEAEESSPESSDEEADELPPDIVATGPPGKVYLNPGL